MPPKGMRKNPKEPIAKPKPKNKFKAPPMVQSSEK